MGISKTLGNETATRWRRFGMLLKDVFSGLEKRAAINIAFGSIDMDYKAFTDHELTSPFAQSLLHTFKDENAVKRVVEDYYVGQSIAGSAMFWYVDKDEILRTAKFVEFNSRGKVENERPYWLHSEMKEKGKLPQEWQRKRTLFGEHLLTRAENRKRKVCIVNTEQAAIVMAILYPQYVWLANTERNLSCNRFDAIKGREVAMVPLFDNNGKQIEAMAENCRELNSNGFLTEVVRWWPENPITGRVKAVSDWIMGL